MDIAAYEAKGKVRQSMINYLKGELKLKSKARLSIFDAHFQYGVCKIAYQADMVENPDAGQPILDDESQTPMMGDDGPLLEPDVIPANERYKVCRIHPDDFLVDEDAGPLDENVNWKAERIRKTLDEVKKDKKYSKAGRNAVKATEIKDQDLKEREQKKKGGLASAAKDELNPDIVVLWEVYDLLNKQWFVVAEGCNEYLIEPGPIPAGIEESPYVDLRFTLRDDSWYPLPPVSQWIDPQRDYCEFRSKLKTHLKRFNRKYTAYTPALEDDSELSKVENGDDGAIIRVSQPNMDVIRPIADAPYDQQLHTNIAYLRHDFEDVAVGANQRGSSSGVDSATEAGILEQRSRQREGDKQGMVMDFLSDIGKKLDQQIKANITQDQAVKVTGVQGEYWELVRTGDYDDINGEYEYSISVGSTTPQLPEIERAQWNAFLGLMAQAPQLATSKQLLTRMAEMHHINDDVMVEELYKIGQQMMAMQQAGAEAKGVGSQPNVTQQNPVAMGGGAAAGINNFRGGQQ
jgi:hypothetical protein